MNSRTTRSIHSLNPACVLAVALAALLAVAQSFVNFESPQSHPIDITPDGTTDAADAADLAQLLAAWGNCA